MTVVSPKAAACKTDITAKPVNYGVTHLFWNIDATNWDSLTLVRNVDGFPTVITDGEAIYTWSSANTSTTTQLGNAAKYHFFDTGSATSSSVTNPGYGVTGASLQGKTVYYGLFVTYTESSIQYTSLCGTASCLVVKDEKMLNTLISSLPDVFKPSNSDLEDFLGLFAFYLSLYKQTATTVFDMANPYSVDYRLLEAQLKQFGASFYKENGLSVSQGRTLLANLIETYTKSGSIAGIQDFIEIVSGYPAKVYTTPFPGGGSNGILDYNSSSFVESLGNWVPENTYSWAATAPYAPCISLIKTSQGSVYPFGHSGSDPYVGNGSFKEKGFMKMTASIASGTQDVIISLGYKSASVVATTSAGSSTLTCKPLVAAVGDYVIADGITERETFVTAVNTTTAELTLSKKTLISASAGASVRFSSVATDAQASLEAMLPTFQSQDYTFSAYFNRGSNGGKSVALALEWYDAKGVYISTSSYGTTLNTASGSANTWQRATVTGTSPGNASYCKPLVKFISCANGDIMYMDAVKFEYGTSAGAFEDSRQVYIKVSPNRVNIVTNPSFEVDGTGWYYSSNQSPMTAGGTAVSTTITSAHLAGAKAGAVALTAPVQVAATINKATIGSTTATVTTSSAHGYSTGNYIAVSYGSNVFYNSITVLTTTTFSIPVPTGIFTGTVPCIIYKPVSGSGNLAPITATFNSLVKVLGAADDPANASVILTTEEPVFATVGSSVTLGSNDIETNGGAVTESYTFLSGNGSTTPSLDTSLSASEVLNSVSYMLSSEPFNIFMGKNIYFNGASGSAASTGITVVSASQYVFSVSAKISSSLPSNIGVAAVPYVLSNSNSASDYKVEKLPSIKTISYDGSKIRVYTYANHHFVVGDKIHILNAGQFSTTGPTSVYTVKEIGSKYLVVTRSASLTVDTLQNLTSCYALWDVSASSWSRVAVCGNTMKDVIATNYTRSIVGLYIVQTYDTTGAGGSYTVALDNALLEKGAFRKFYFDGDYDSRTPFQDAARDTKWAGTVNASKSYYYKNFAVNMTRLNNLLPSVIPYGSGVIGQGPGWSGVYTLRYIE